MQQHNVVDSKYYVRFNNCIIINNSKFIMTNELRPIILLNIEYTFVFLHGFKFGNSNIMKQELKLS